MRNEGEFGTAREPIYVEIRACTEPALGTVRWTAHEIGPARGARGGVSGDALPRGDRASVVADLEARGYVPAGEKDRYRLYDATCGLCGAYVPESDTPPWSEGWYGGREYRRLGGRLRVLRVRCAAHPFDISREIDELRAAGLL